MATTEPSTLNALARRAHDDVYNALRAIEQTDLHEQPHAAERLPEIAELADKLATALDEFCDPKPATADSDDAAEPDRRPAITVIVGDHCEALYGIQGIARAIARLDEPETLELAMALCALSKQVCDGMGSLLMSVEQKIEQTTGMKVRQ